MKILFLMAIRNLWRHARRTLLTVASIAFGLAVILWLQCILAGRNKSMIDRVTSTRTGHLQLHRQDYLKDKAIQFTFTPPENLIEQLPAGAAYAPRAYLPSLISSGEQSSSIMLVGIDPSREAKVTDIANSAKNSSYLEDDASPDCASRQILIGKSLANFLHADVGAKLVIMTQAADGTLGNDLFRVKGIYESGSPEMDKSVAYAPISCIAKVGALTGVHEVAIHLPDPRTLEATRARLQSVLPATPPLSVSTWKEAMPSLASVISLNDSVLLMISLVLFIVIAMGIVNVLLIGVFERTREFGVMIALGTTPTQLRSVILVESFVLAIAATVLGTALGLLLVAYHSWHGFDLSPFIGERTTVDNFKLDFLIFPIVEIRPYIKSVIATLGFVLTAGVYPAFRASRLNPIDAMRAT